LSLLGQAILVGLRREGYRESGAFAWVRTTQFAAIAGRAGEFLHPEELAILRGFKAERRQASYLLGRYTGKSALGICVGPDFQPAQTVIAAGIFGQPVVQGQAWRPWGVSISHTDHLVCGLAFPEAHPMAIDVEEIDEARTKVMLTQIGGEERDHVQSVCGSIDLAATVVWTAKEALSKALRCGMTCPYELLEVSGLEERNGTFLGRFKNFGQYQYQSWRRGKTVVTIVLPKKTELEFLFPASL